MSNVFHPGLILIALGFVAMLVPKALRKYVLAVGPLAAVAAAIQLPLGTDLSFEFIYGLQLHYLYVDKLSWIFTFIFSIMAAIGSIYASHNDSKTEALCSLGYTGCAIGATLAKDWLTLIFFWEALAVTSLFLVWCRNTPSARRAGFRYILVHMFGGNMLLAGIFLKVSSGDVLIANLTAGPHDYAFWLILLGICVNVAMPPVNAWLVDAYSESTITGGVFMSSFTTKVAVYALIRVFAGTELLMWGGALMALYGACYAIMENDMRRLLAHHIISQTGFMVAGAGIGTGMALNGATAHAFCDILFKSLLFMCAGSIMYATGIRQINRLGAMAKKMSFVCVCFFAAAFSISGIPLFNGFISKAITVNAAYAAGQHLLYTLLEIASIGTFLSIPLKMGYFIFLRKDDKGVTIKQELPKNMYVGMGLGAFLCTLYGVWPNLLYQYLPFEAPVYQPFLPEHILQYVQMLGMALIPFLMYLGKMEPHDAISLDTDWFYRRPLAAAISGVSHFLCALCNALGCLWQGAYVKFNELTANPMIFLEAPPFTEKSSYDANNYRGPIGDPMLIIFSVLVCAIGYFVVML